MMEALIIAVVGLLIFAAAYFCEAHDNMRLRDERDEAEAKVADLLEQLVLAKRELNATLLQLGDAQVALSIAHAAQPIGNRQAEIGNALHEPPTLSARLECGCLRSLGCTCAAPDAPRGPLKIH